MLLYKYGPSCIYRFDAELTRKLGLFATGFGLGSLKNFLVIPPSFSLDLYHLSLEPCCDLLTCCSHCVLPIAISQPTCPSASARPFAQYPSTSFPHQSLPLLPPVLLLSSSFPPPCPLFILLPPLSTK